jgi:hypothetical protein
LNNYVYLVNVCRITKDNSYVGIAEDCSGKRKTQKLKGYFWYSDIYINFNNVVSCDGDNTVSNEEVHLDLPLVNYLVVGFFD